MNEVFLKDLSKTSWLECSPVDVYLIVRRSNKTHKTISILPFVFSDYWTALGYFEDYGLDFQYYAIYKTNINYK